MPGFIHNDPAFKDLISIVADIKGIDPALVEKDYWIMHVLYGLQQQGIEFELKGGTSLSKGFDLIHRFSEDIDIHISTNLGLTIEGKDDKKEIKEGRKEFYDKLSSQLKIAGIVNVERDTAFDDEGKYRSGGIRLHYNTKVSILEGLKEGILLEVGFDTVAPNRPITISSWIMDHLLSLGKTSEIIDNRAVNVPCYLPGYTLVEKLQTIVNKHRKYESGGDPKNFMRQYYDVYCLLNSEEVTAFIGTAEYLEHKAKRFRGADKTPPLPEHPALRLNNPEQREAFRKLYQATEGLYYMGQPDFKEVLNKIQEHLPNL